MLSVVTLALTYKKQSSKRPDLCSVCVLFVTVMLYFLNCSGLCVVHVKPCRRYFSLMPGITTEFTFTCCFSDYVMQWNIIIIVLGPRC